MLQLGKYTFVECPPFPHRSAPDLEQYAVASEQTFLHRFAAAPCSWSSTPLLHARCSHPGPRPSRTLSSTPLRRTCFSCTGPHPCEALRCKLLCRDPCSASIHGGTEPRAFCRCGSPAVPTLVRALSDTRDECGRSVPAVPARIHGSAEPGDARRPPFPHLPTVPPKTPEVHTTAAYPVLSVAGGRDAAALDCFRLAVRCCDVATQDYCCSSLNGM